MPRRKLNLFDNPPPGGLEEEGTAAYPIKVAPPQPAAVPLASIAAVRKDKLKRELKKKRALELLAVNDGVKGQGSMNKRRKLEEKQARQMRRGRR